MKHLYKIFHQLDHDGYKKAYEKRMLMDTVIRLDLAIKPMNQSEVYELYYIPTNRMIRIVGEIYRVSADLNFIFKDLPSVAQDQFIIDCIVEELFHTNELEGVKSTREEIAESVKHVKLNKQEKRRFNSMIKSYLNLVYGELMIPIHPRDIRKIYDEITKGELNEGDFPDGEIFRKGIVQVLKKSGSGKVIHRGILPEEKVISEIARLLRFMNEEDEIPPIIKVAIGHYYFGYIHPFYDGNGRTSRFISSVYLAQALGEIPALSLSRGCNNMKSKYLETFEITNSLLNKGEMNHFIDTFLEIILKTLIDMKNKLKEKAEFIRLAREKIMNDEKIIEKNQLDFMFILAQNHFFENNAGLTVKELAQAMNLSEVTVRKVAKALLEQSLIEQIGIRPAYFAVNPMYFES